MIQSFRIQPLKNSPTFDELNKMEQARLSLKQRERTFKLTFSEPSPSPSFLLKLSIVKAVGENRLGVEWRKIARISIKGRAEGYIPDPTSDKQNVTN